ncbi:cysteinyl-tRNA synthetase [Salegentibacter sp. 24]|uniref:endo alpha-1,4 polygalactosaminidase n=1 Tax=Salegentibacter sp. 24 TaxID=2183986 RepID=UPI00105C8DA8|nr:endo alpha-1,4 polygalactosaminidase [Salegentibacter sp. 24]TDN81246.1 cysteinyl-tRNA synthetase [Salegentibacter sp. 24]
MNVIKLSTALFCCLFLTNQTLIAQETIDYRKEMRDLVIELSESAKTKHPNFIIIPQNGVELLIEGSENQESRAIDYLNAIDAVAQEDLFYGYPKINKLTPLSENLYLKTYLDLAKKNKKEVLTIDYASTQELITDSYKRNKESGYISFAAPRRELDHIPAYPVFCENSKNIDDLSEAKNFLYFLNYANYSTKKELISELSFTNYDLIVLDLFFQNQAFTKENIAQLKKKKNGGDRLVIAYMSVGEAENYRYYWKKNWNSKPPEWFVEENPNWEGNFKVKYWKDTWKELIYGNEEAYLKKIINAGFDGVYLDIIDGFQYFENKE